MVQLTSDDSVLVIVPHPDDETLGCGGIIQRSLSIGAEVKVVYVTYGDANEWSFIKSNRFRLPTIMPSSVKKMGHKRYDEAVRACQTLGLSKDDIYFLGYPDFGLLRIWYRHWLDTKPAKGMLTRATKVSYGTAYRPGAIFRGEEILRDLTNIIKDFKPSKVFTSHRLDYNADHQALYLFVRVALWDISHVIKPEFYAFLTHFKTWPQPRGLLPNKQLLPPSISKREMHWQTFDLKEHEIETKENALREHMTQMAATPTYLLAFIRQNELFGDFSVLLTKKMLEDEYHQEGENYLVRKLNNIDTDVDEEGEEYIGLDDHTIEFEDNYLIETVHITKKFRRDATVDFYIFGYKFSEKFAESPKYRITINKKGLEINNLENRVNSDLVKLLRDKNNQTLELRFPLDLMDNPDILLVNVRSVVNRIMVDWVPWRIISMK